MAEKSKFYQKILLRFVRNLTNILGLKTPKFVRPRRMCGILFYLYDGTGAFGCKYRPYKHPAFYPSVTQKVFLFSNMESRQLLRKFSNGSSPEGCFVHDERFAARYWRCQCFRLLM
ncbi:hypothetical protein RF11_01351 [Thelohanellus kitauei]|uniref:Uncharacterized protein n=1 Tax=Thelohanellus kitauei TaxID=669202 RepID=A0A0C2NCV2_THEKT|nr:hypothetical protein RF11_01351 [Thelohanellus kitauei]